MRVFILNLDSAEQRWEFMARRFSSRKFTVCRVQAVDGRALRFPIESYSETGYHRFHGRGTNPAEVGCYLSHIKAMRAFLETNDSHALICEDDVVLYPGFEEVLERALEFSDQWNVLRLSGLSIGRHVQVADLSGCYALCVNLERLKGSGIYVIDRLAAKTLAERLLPMRLPFDHAVDREWVYGLRAASVVPFPTSQTESGMRSSIQSTGALKLRRFRRWITTYPYQAYNEGARWLFRTRNCIQWILALKLGARSN